MNYRIICIILFVCLPTIWAQKAKGFPVTEIAIYKIIKNTINQKDSLLYVGYSRAEVTQALGQPDTISRNDDNDGDELSYSGGLGLTYTDGYPTYPYDDLFIVPNRIGSTNPYVLSKRFKLGIGRPLPVDLLDNYNYRVYTDKSDIPLTPEEETALAKGTWRQYVWNLMSANGELSDYFLAIDVKDGKIIKIYKGASL